MLALLLVDARLGSRGQQVAWLRAGGDGDVGKPMRLRQYSQPCAGRYHVASASGGNAPRTR
jgi:hypothetical protein